MTSGLVTRRSRANKKRAHIARRRKIAARRRKRTQR